MEVHVTTHFSDLLWSQKCVVWHNKIILLIKIKLCNAVWNAYFFRLILFNQWTKISFFEIFSFSVKFFLILSATAWPSYESFCFLESFAFTISLVSFRLNVQLFSNLIDEHRNGMMKSKKTFVNLNFWNLSWRLL